MDERDLKYMGRITKLEKHILFLKNKNTQMVDHLRGYIADLDEAVEIKDFGLITNILSDMENWFLK